MNGGHTVDEFVNCKVLPEYREIVAKFRRIMSTNFPYILEEMRGGTDKYYGVPVYRKRNIIITLSPTKKGITISFSEGKKFHDKFAKLEGQGNKSLNLRISTVDELIDEEVVYYIEQAILFDEK